MKDCALHMSNYKPTPAVTSNSDTPWPQCPWCQKDMSVFDRDPVTHRIRFACLRAGCPCYRQAMPIEREFWL